MTQRNYRLRLKRFIGWTTYFEVCFHELNTATGLLLIQQTDGTRHILYGKKLEIQLPPEFLAQEIQANMEAAKAKSGSVVVTDNIHSQPELIKDELSPEEVAIEVQKAEEGLERWRMAQRNIKPLDHSNEANLPETTSTFAN